MDNITVKLQAARSIRRAVDKGKIATLKDSLRNISGIDAWAMFVYLSEAVERISIQNFIECADLYKTTLFSMKDDKGHNLLHKIVLHNRIELVLYSFFLGADANDVDSAGETPLHIATRISTCITYLLLLKGGIKVNVQDNRGYTPLHLAIIQDMPEQERYDICLLLLEAGADPTIENNIGLSPFTYATIIKSIPEILPLLAEYKGQKYGGDESYQRSSRSSSTNMGEVYIDTEEEFV